MVTTFFLLLLLSVLPPEIPSHNITCCVIEGDVSFSEAQTACNENYTDLITVYNDQDNKMVANLIKNASKEKGWIGLNRSDSPTNKWSNGDLITFDKLSDNSSSPCCGAMLSNGSWTCLNCTEENYFMCYKEVTGCSEFPYHPVTEKKTWYEAQRYCRTNYTDLVSIRDEGQNIFVQTKGTNTFPFWIGLLRDEWQWVDGGNSAYRNWSENSNSEDSDNKHVCMSTDGSWQAVTTDMKYFGLCYLKSNTTSTRPAQSLLISYHNISKNMKQSEAQAACRMNYTDLVTVYSDEVNSVLVNLIKETHADWWIGLNKNQSSLKWSHGDPVIYKNMDGVCTSSDPCCYVMKTDGKWDPIQCITKKPFMCFQQDAKGDPKYYLICKYMTWYDAQQYCRKNYTDLVSITNLKQNDKVKSEGSKINVPFWIGLLSDNWEWADGGRSAYRNWETFTNQNQSCVTIKPDGKWSREPCDSHHYALCYNTSLHLSNETMNWEEALDYCSRKNQSRLLEIENEISQKEVEWWLRNQNTFEPVWVGLRQSWLFGFWFWPRGTAISSWNNWYGAKQPEHQLSHHCGAIDPKQGFKWRDMNCASTFKVLCFR